MHAPIGEREFNALAVQSGLVHASASPRWAPTTPHSTALKKHCWAEATAAPFCVIVVQQIGATVGIGGGRWGEWGCPKDTIWHLGPFGTQSAFLAKMGTLQILSIKPPQVPYCHIWQVQFLMLMWDIALGQSKITGIFFRQGHRVRDIISSFVEPGDQ